MSHRSSLIQALRAYTSKSRDELAFKKQFLELLEHPRAFFRDHLPGHITASSWIIDKGRNFALLTHHAKLDRWLQPGGHADGHEDVLAVAHREAYEETGLTTLQPLSTEIFDLDIHLIPGRIDFPEHFHYDIRFLFQASMEESVTISEESRDLAWIANEDVPRRTGNNISILRMAQKVWAGRAECGRDA
jgi:NTP pyrophosphohydrolases including oxidative damage repair enzymes